MGDPGDWVSMGDPGDWVSMGDPGYILRTLCIYLLTLGPNVPLLKGDWGGGWEWDLGIEFKRNPGVSGVSGVTGVSGVGRCRVGGVGGMRGAVGGVLGVLRVLRVEV